MLPASSLSSLLLLGQIQVVKTRGNSSAITFLVPFTSGDVGRILTTVMKGWAQAACWVQWKPAEGAKKAGLENRVRIKGGWGQPTRHISTGK